MPDSYNGHMYYRVLVASQSFHGQESLTYNSDESLAIGQIVQVELQRKPVLGIIEAKVAKPSFTTKPIGQTWDIAIPSSSFRLLSWMKDYYPAPLGVLTELFTPPALPKKLTTPLVSRGKTQKPLALPKLTAEQQSVLQSITSAKTRSFLLHGDTGTGKTRIYIELTEQSLDKGLSVIVLTPEIGLTEPLLQTFTERFGERVVVTHSQMTPAERRQVWLRIALSTEPLVVIGPRSAIFVPLSSIGLIVVDEVHDSAYKQEQAPYYQTTRVAGRLAELHEARLILGSATPLLSDYFAFRQKKLPILRMQQLAIESTHLSEQHIIDQRDKSQFVRSPWISTPLLSAIEQALANKEQSMLFLNRRGSARLVMCENCGWQAMCPHCDVPLTFHQDQHRMRCHSCDYANSPPSICPECGVSELVFRSIGTKALETELQRLYPRATISRFDRDTERLERLHHQHDDLQSGSVDIIIGTQAVVKGFDLPKLSVVGIINADSGLQIPDFTASERSFQLISQVSGRIGRGHRAGKLFVQSYQPDNSVLKLALDKDYESFINQELVQRESYKFPPYYYLLKITCSRASAANARSACDKLAMDIKNTNKRVIVEGPTPRFVEKMAGRYAWHIIVKAKDRTLLTEIAKALPGNITYDLDPSDLL